MARCGAAVGSTAGREGTRRTLNHSLHVRGEGGSESGAMRGCDELDDSREKAAVRKRAENVRVLSVRVYGADGVDESVAAAVWRVRSAAGSSRPKYCVRRRAKRGLTGRNRPS